MELKLDVAPEHLNILKRHPLFLSQRSRRRDEVVSIYLDSKDRVFHRHGLSFRVRRKGKQLLQTIKGPYLGVLDRGEREIPFIDDGNTSGHPGSADALMCRLDRNVPTALKPVFKTIIERETCLIGGVEVCLDRGEIVAGRRSTPIAEIELELKSGNRKELFALARRISAIVPAEISVKSKSERGYEFVDGMGEWGIAARNPVLPRFATAREALQIICSECLHHLISNIPGVRAHMAEALHQARVAMRRLDAVMKLARSIQGETATKIDGELKWIGDELADPRELDVFMADFLAPLMETGSTELKLAAAYRACEQLREKAYGRAVAALGSQRFRMFLIDVAEWSEAGKGRRGPRSQANGEPSAKQIVSRALSKMSRKLRSAGEFEELDLRRLHKVRLRAKRLRYAIEFTRSLYDVDSDRIEGMLGQLGKLQSALGKLTDMASARTILKRIAGEAKAHGPIIIAGHQQIHKYKRLKKAEKAFQKLEKVKPFWT